MPVFQFADRPVPARDASRLSRPDIVSGPDRAGPSGVPRHHGGYRPTAGLQELPRATSVMTARQAAEAVHGPYVRAARALLGWTLIDLAHASGLSVSTVRRLEQDVCAVSLRNRLTAVDALQTSGIRFLAVEDGTLALAEPDVRPGGVPVASSRPDGE